MSKQITMLDLVDKLTDHLNRNTNQVLKTDLIDIYVGDARHPWINSEHTLNEKIRLLCAVKILKKINPAVYTIDWDILDIKVSEWTAAGAH